MKNYDKSDIEKIVKDEIKKYLSDKLDDEMAKIIKSSTSKSRKEAVDISKEAISKLAEFLWVRRSIWKGDIK
jgi:uncharacterized protein YpuA (DUF1002 family)